MWKPKTVATTDNVYTYLRLFNRECEKKSVKNNPSMIEYK